MSLMIVSHTTVALSLKSTLTISAVRGDLKAVIRIHNALRQGIKAVSSERQTISIAVSSSVGFKFITVKLMFKLIGFLAFVPIEIYESLCL